MSKYSFVVTTLGGWSNTSGTVMDIHNSMSGYDYEIVVVDDSWTGDFSECNLPNTRFTTSALMYGGFAKAVNKAVKETDGKWLIILHDDVRFIAGKPAVELVSMLEASYSPQLASPMQLFSAGNISQTYLKFIRSIYGTRMVEVYRSWYKEFPKANVQVFADAIQSGMWAISREHFDAVGGLDERYVPCLFEDIDLCLKIRERGGKVMYVPSVMVTHNMHRYVNEARVNLNDVGYTNMNKLVEKWQDKPEFTFHYVEE